MTVKGLMELFERYYGGKYSGTFGETVAGYLNGYPADFLMAAARVVIMRFSHTYNKLPGVAEIEKNLDEIWDEVPEYTPLPEPEHIITDEERAEGLKIAGECVEILRGKKGPLAGAFSKVLQEVV